MQSAPGAPLDACQTETGQWQETARTVGTYYAWRSEQEAGVYEDVLGPCKSAMLQEIRRHSCVLTPGRYVGAEPAEEDSEPFDEKMRRLVETSCGQMEERHRLDASIASNLKELGHGG